MIDFEIVSYLNVLLLLFVISHFFFYYTGYYLLNKLLNLELNLNYTSTIVVGFSIFGILSFFAYLLNLKLNFFIIIIFFFAVFCIFKLRKKKIEKKIFYSFLSYLLVLSLLINIFPKFSINAFEDNYSSDFWSYLANLVMLSENQIINIKIPQFKDQLNYSYTPLNPIILYLGLLKKITNQNIFHLWQAMNIYNIFLLLGLLNLLCKKIFQNNKILILIFFTIYFLIIFFNNGAFGISKEIFKYFNYPRHIVFINLIFLNVLFFQFYQNKRNIHYLIILIIFSTISIHPQSIILISINFFSWFCIEFKKNKLKYFKKEIYILFSIICFSTIWLILIKTYVPQEYFDHVGINLTINYLEYKKIFESFYIFNLSYFLEQKYNFLLLISLYGFFFWYLFQIKENEKKFIFFLFFQVNVILFILLNPLILNILWIYVPPFATTRLIDSSYVPELISMCLVIFFNIKFIKNNPQFQKLGDIFIKFIFLRSVIIIFIIMFITVFIFRNNNLQKNSAYIELFEFINKNVPTKSILISDENTSVQLNSFKYIHILNSREHYLQVFKKEFKKNKILADNIFLNKDLSLLKEYFLNEELKIFIIINKKMSGEVNQNDFNTKEFFLETLLDNKSYKVIEIKYER